MLLPRLFAITLVCLGGIGLARRPATAEVWTFQSYAGQNTGGPPGSEDGVAGAARFDSPFTIAASPDGSLYVGSRPTLRRITPGRVVTTLTLQPGNHGMPTYDYRIAVGPDGTGYVAFTGGSRILRVSADGVVNLFAGYSSGSADGTGTAAQLMQPRAIAVGPDGTIYVADTGNNTIRKVTPAGVVTTLAGTAGQFGGADGTGAAARFSRPMGIAVGPDGTIYVTDAGWYFGTTIRKVTPDGAVTTLAGVYNQTGFKDGVGAAARFSGAMGIAVGADGMVYVADHGNHAVRRISPAGAVTTLAGAGEWAESAGAMRGAKDGTGRAARLFSPEALAVGGDGAIYVADTQNHAIRRITTAGLTTTFAGAPAFSGGADGAGSAARFSGPLWVAAGPGGSVHVADTGSCTVRKITAGGAVTTLAGVAEECSVINGTGTGPSGARFLLPKGIAADVAGTLYVADWNCVRKVTAAGTVTTLAGSPGQAASVDGTGANARFHTPTGVAVGPSGTIYVTDSYHHTIRQLTPDGAVTTLAGSAGQNGSADGTGAAARFNQPLGVAVGTDGTVFVADAGNSTVRKITPAGDVTTLGGAAGQSDSRDGQGGAARFHFPYGITAAPDGSLFVADVDTVRKVTADGVVSTVGGVHSSTAELRDGSGSDARFYSAAGIAAGPDGRLYIAERQTNAIRAGTAAGAGGCMGTPQDSCIQDPAGAASFLVQLRYESAQAGGLYGKAGAIPLQSVGVYAGGLFWFFSPDNPELMIKVLNGCDVNGKYWVFSSAGTNLGMTLDVTNTRSGERLTFANPDLTPAAPIVEVSAFGCGAPARDAESRSSLARVVPWVSERTPPPPVPYPGPPVSTTKADSPSAVPGPCQPSATQLCVDGAVAGDGRFRLGLEWQTAQSGGQAGTAKALALTSLGVARGGLFWFFASSNPEVLVKVLDGCGVNGRFWVFTSAGTNVGMELTVSDVVKGTSTTYVNPDQTNAVPVQDVTAFPCQ